ncbi:unnamed protein product [Diplocarpon coronariae]
MTYHRDPLRKLASPFLRLERPAQQGSAKCNKIRIGLPDGPTAARRPPQLGDPAGLLLEDSSAPWQALCDLQQEVQCGDGVESKEITSLEKPTALAGVLRYATAERFPSFELRASSFEQESHKLTGPCKRSTICQPREEWLTDPCESRRRATHAVPSPTRRGARESGDTGRGGTMCSNVNSRNLSQAKRDQARRRGSDGTSTSHSTAPRLWSGDGRLAGEMRSGRDGLGKTSHSQRHVEEHEAGEPGSETIVMPVVTNVTGQEELTASSLGHQRRDQVPSCGCTNKAEPTRGTGEQRVLIEASQSLPRSKGDGDERSEIFLATGRQRGHTKFESTVEL